MSQARKNYDRWYADCGLAGMLNDRESFTVDDGEELSAEEQYELWDWARAAGVSAEELKKALLQSDRCPT